MDNFYLQITDGVGLTPNRCRCDTLNGVGVTPNNIIIIYLKYNIIIFGEIMGKMNKELYLSKGYYQLCMAILNQAEKDKESKKIWARSKIVLR